MVAIRDGLVEEVGGSARESGGRWLRLRHADGSASWYMHLDGVRDGLARGAKVHAGQALATLGRTGVNSGPTHLHFAITTGGGRKERHRDPTRLLARAALLPAAMVP